MGSRKGSSGSASASYEKDKALPPPPPPSDNNSPKAAVGGSGSISQRGDEKKVETWGWGVGTGTVTESPASSSFKPSPVRSQTYPLPFSPSLSHLNLSIPPSDPNTPRSEYLPPPRGFISTSTTSFNSNNYNYSDTGMGGVANPDASVSIGKKSKWGMVGRKVSKNWDQVGSSGKNKDKYKGKDQPRTTRDDDRLIDDSRANDIGDLSEFGVLGGASSSTLRLNSTIATNGSGIGKDGIKSNTNINTNANSRKRSSSDGPLALQAHGGKPRRSMSDPQLIYHSTTSPGGSGSGFGDRSYTYGYNQPRITSTSTSSKTKITSNTPTTMGNTPRSHPPSAYSSPVSSKPSSSKPPLIRRLGSGLLGSISKKTSSDTISSPNNHSQSQSPMKRKKSKHHLQSPNCLNGGTTSTTGSRNRKDSGMNQQDQDQVIEIGWGNELNTPVKESEESGKSGTSSGWNLLGRRKGSKDSATSQGQEDFVGKEIGMPYKVDHEVYAEDKQSPSNLPDAWIESLRKQGVPEKDIELIKSSTRNKLLQSMKEDITPAPPQIQLEEVPDTSLNPYDLLLPAAPVPNTAVSLSPGLEMLIPSRGNSQHDHEDVVVPSEEEYGTVKTSSSSGGHTFGEFGQAQRQISISEDGHKTISPRRSGSLRRSLSKTLGNKTRRTFSRSSSLKRRSSTFLTRSTPSSPQKDRSSIPAARDSTRFSFSIANIFPRPPSRNDRLDGITERGMSLDLLTPPDSLLSKPIQREQQRFSVSIKKFKEMDLNVSIEGEEGRGGWADSFWNALGEDRPVTAPPSPVSQEGVGQAGSPKKHRPPPLPLVPTEYTVRGTAKKDRDEIKKVSKAVEDSAVRVPPPRKSSLPTTGPPTHSEPPAATQVDVASSSPTSLPYEDNGYVSDDGELPPSMFHSPVPKGLSPLRPPKANRQSLRLSSSTVTPTQFDTFGQSTPFKRTPLTTTTLDVLDTRLITPTMSDFGGKHGVRRSSFESLERAGQAVYRDSTIGNHSSSAISTEEVLREKDRSSAMSFVSSVDQESLVETEDSYRGTGAATSMMTSPSASSLGLPSSWHGHPAAAPPPPLPTARPGDDLHCISPAPPETPSLPLMNKISTGPVGHASPDRRPTRRLLSADVPEDARSSMAASSVRSSAGYSGDHGLPPDLRSLHGGRSYRGQSQASSTSAHEATIQQALPGKMSTPRPQSMDLDNDLREALEEARLAQEEGGTEVVVT